MTHLTYYFLSHSLSITFSVYSVYLPIYNFYLLYRVSQETRGRRETLWSCGSIWKDSR